MGVPIYILTVVLLGGLNISFMYLSLRSQEFIISVLRSVNSLHCIVLTIAVRLFQNDLGVFFPDKLQTTAPCSKCCSM
jgi:DMSO reductase anchor subunit